MRFHLAVILALSGFRSSFIETQPAFQSFQPLRQIIYSHTLLRSGFLTMRHITAQSGQGDFNAAQPLCVFVQFVFDAPLAGLEVLEMFQHEIFSVVCHCPALTRHCV